MVDRHKPASTVGTGTGQRAAIACRSCRQRKVKASSPSPLLLAVLLPPISAPVSVLVIADCCLFFFPLLRFRLSLQCDAQSDPSENGCGPCRRAGKECMLDPMSDGRRSVNRKCVDRLQQRIEMLEARSQIVGDRAGWDPSDDSLRRHLHPHLQQYHPPPSEYTPMSFACGPRSSQSTNTTDTIPAPPPPPAQPVPTQPRTQLPLAPLPTPPPNPPAAISVRVEQAALSPGSGSSPGAASSNSHGSPSFYGATSHPHVVSASEEAAQMQLFEEADAGGIGIDLDPMSPHLRAHLFQSFFKYQTLWVDVVDKDAFLSQSQSQSQSRWRSGFLENAMLACGTRLSTSKSVRALGPKYCEWAKEDVLRAMSDPTPANLQGFLLLSEYEVTQGNDRPAWMYCGVACRMLSDLGLHELASIGDGSGGAQEAAAPVVAAATARESDLAYALLSACVVYEGVWTLYLGRPSSIPRAVMRTAAARCRQRRRSDTPWLNAWVGLCVPMAEITRLLNEKAAEGDDDDNSGHESEHQSGHGNASGDGDADRLSALRTVARQVDDWYENLPPELAYHEDRLINMHLAGYGLHAQYCKIQILLQQALAQLPQRPPTQPRSRPLLSNPRKRPRSQMADDRGASADRAVEMAERGERSERADRADRAGSVPDEPSGLVAYQHALRIARLVVTYREAFGMEQLPSIMLDNAVVAATAMIRHHNSSIGTGTGTGAGDTVWLRQLLKSMESVQPHFPIIARMLDSLKQICGSGPLMSMILPARRGSAEASLDFGAMDRHSGSIGSTNNSSNSNDDSQDSMALGGGPDMLWDCFDAAITPSIFQSSAFSDSVLGLPPPSEALGSVLSQAVS